MVAVQDFDGVTVEDGDDLAGEVGGEGRTLLVPARGGIGEHTNKDQPFRSRRCYQHRRTFVSLASSFTITRRHSSEVRRGGSGLIETVYPQFFGSKITHF